MKEIRTVFNVTVCLCVCVDLKLLTRKCKWMCELFGIKAHMFVTPAFLYLLLMKRLQSSVAFVCVSLKGFHDCSCDHYCTVDWRAELIA